MKSILPEWLYCEIANNYSLGDLQEIRIRKDKPIQVCYKGKCLELKSSSGLYLKPIYASRELIGYIIRLVTKNSIYAFDEQIKNGFIVSDNGIRIGLCGVAVNDNGKVSFLKNITSLNIRIAHEIRDCANEIMPYIVYEGGIKDTLIISAPGAGKTTMLRDIIRNLSDNYHVPNIMVVDEKFEIASEDLKFNLGNNVDIMQGANKQFSFYEAIKVMNPSVIVTDELISKEDVDGVRFAKLSGVNIVATAHAKDVDDLKQKPFIGEVLNQKLFERIILLSKRNGVGKIEAIFDENLFALYLNGLQ